MIFPQELTTNDSIAERLAHMGYALNMMMTLKRDEILALLEARGKAYFARPTADVDVHNTLAVSIPMPAPTPPHITTPHRARVIISPPEMIPGTPEQLAEVQEHMRRYALQYPQPYIFVERSRLLFLPVADLNYFTFVAELFRTSEETRVPIVGCIIRPLLTDLIDTMKHIYPNEKTILVSDSGLLYAYLQYGQRTPIFSSTLREQEICFTYLKANPELPPSRIEFPKWMLDADEHEELFRQILATSHLNVNYPPRLQRGR